MKIGILSDTHNHIENVESAIKLLRQEDVNILVHCGDFTDPATIRLFYGFRVIAVYGNGDYATGQIRQNLLELSRANSAAPVYTGELGGVRLAVTHGHLPGKLTELLNSGGYDYIFTGHTHTHADETIGATRLINPGALGGRRNEARQFCVLDLATGQARFVFI